MFDMDTVAKRYFDLALTIEHDDGSKERVELHLLPPTLEQQKKVIQSSGNSFSKPDASAESVHFMLNNNRDGIEIPLSYIEKLTFDQLSALGESYWAWVLSVHNEKN